MLTDVRETIIVTLLIPFILFTETIRYDFVPVGIVDYRVYNYCVVDKGLYKVKVYNEDLRSGDVLYFAQKGKENDNDNQISHNILYIDDNYQILFNFTIRSYIFNRIESFNGETSAVLKKLIYGITDDYDLEYDLGYGLLSYYLFSFLYRKARKKSMICLFVYSLFFAHDLKFILLELEFIGDHFKLDRTDKTGVKMLVCAALNRELLKNYSLLLPLLFSMTTILPEELDFKVYLYLIESVLFGECDITGIFLFSSLLKLRIMILLSGILVICLPFLEGIFLQIIRLYSLINGFKISIRGSISLLSFLIFLMVRKMIKYRNVFIDLSLCVLLTIDPLNDPFTQVSFIDVGQGDAILISDPFNRHKILIDTGSGYSYYKLYRCLCKEGIYAIDYLVITHDDEDHNGNVTKLGEDFRIKNIITTGQDLSAGSIQLTYLNTGENDNDNDNSLVYLFTTDGYRFLFTGDISANVERKLVVEKLIDKIDFLKVSHHGSNTATSPYFISAVQPRIAFISTNGKYNHPHNEVIKTLEEYKVDYYVTKKSGTISLYFTAGPDFLKTTHNEFVIIG